MSNTSKFPLDPINNQIYIDNNGVEWKYKSGLKRWFESKFHKKTDIVSLENDGLVDTITYEKLEFLDLYFTNYGFSTFKVFPGRDAYFYYLYSPSGLVEIRHEDDDIHINVNEQKLYAHYYRIICSGDRGFRGPRGETGDPGTPPPDEVDYIPNRDGQLITGTIYTPIPIGTYFPNSTITPISLRIFGLRTDLTEFNVVDQFNYWFEMMRNHLLNNAEKLIFSKLQQFLKKQEQDELANGELTGGGNADKVVLSPILADQVDRNRSPLLEIDINPLNSTFVIVNNGLSIQPSAINVNYNKSLGILTFSISGNWPTAISARSRQRGPTGDRGDTPLNYISELICEFPDSNVRADEVLTHFRLDCENDNFYVSYSRLDSQDEFKCLNVDGIAAITATAKPHLGRYAAVERIAKPSKKIVLYDNSLKELTVEDPNFLQWQPQGGCQTARSYDDYKFDWIPKTDRGTCYVDAKWSGPDGPRNSKYPHEILLPNKPVGESCCQDDFFIFPESGDC
jgi:hypothetical protein